MFNLARNIGCFLVPKRSFWVGAWNQFSKISLENLNEFLPKAFQLLINEKLYFWARFSFDRIC